MAEHWEYKVAPVPPEWDHERTEDSLNRMGLQGWDLVTQYISNAGYGVFVFKRPKK
jgi:hypothetical protein